MSPTGRIYEPVTEDDARVAPVRLTVLQADEHASVDRIDEPKAMSFPHLVLREGIALVGLSLVLVVISLLFDAPLEEIANPDVTPNPSKAPWYFLGLQELLHYYPPFVAGVLLPGLVVLALFIVPYFDVNIRRKALWEGRAPRRAGMILGGTLALVAFFYLSSPHPVWPLIVPTLAIGVSMALPGLLGTETGFRRWLAHRSLPFFVFLWFLIVSVVLTVIGTLFRGPGWSFTLPWRDGIY
jgi:quinol---cytochrome c reductase cytochrome c subunit, bacillus type